MHKNADDIENKFEHHACVYFTALTRAGDQL